IQSALFGNGWQDSVLNASLSTKVVFENFVFIGLNFPTPNFLLLFIGLAVLCKKSPSRAFAHILLAVTFLFFIFAFRYKVPDRHAFFLPFYCMAAIFIALGADWLLNKYDSRVFAVLILLFAILPAGVYFVTPEIARKYYPSLAERRQRPYRDEYTYWLQPWKTGDDGAERFATEALQSVEQDAVIYAYTTDVHAMLYVQQVKGVRPDIMIVSDYDHSEDSLEFNAESISQIINEKPVYVTSNRTGYRPGFLDEGYKFIEQGLIYKVVESKD
ncbi:MAG: hypothetical protein WC962_02020, partial [Phycisphaerae bacterium]